MKKSYAAFMNPEHSDRAETRGVGQRAGEQGELERMIGLSRQYDFFSMKGDVTSLIVDGNKMTAHFQGSMAGFPAQSFTFLLRPRGRPVEAQLEGQRRGQRYARQVRVIDVVGSPRPTGPRPPSTMCRFERSRVE